MKTISSFPIIGSDGNSIAQGYILEDKDIHGYISYGNSASLDSEDGYISDNTLYGTITEARDAIIKMVVEREETNNLLSQPSEEKPKVDGGGKRYNEGKRLWHLLPMEALEDMVKVLEFGAEKYDKHNWKRGFSYTSLLDCLQRHMVAYGKGEDIDPESGVSHLGHALCNLVFLSYFEKYPELYKKFDDRFKLEEK